MINFREIKVPGNIPVIQYHVEKYIFCCSNDAVFPALGAWGL